MERDCTPKLLAILALGVLLTSLLPQNVVAADPESDIERDARLARRSAGLRAGSWSVSGLEEVSGAETSNSLQFEGFFQKGMDKHLAWISTASLWRRTQSVTTSGGLGGSSTESTTAWVVPFFTALKFHPFSEPGDRWEPFVDAGAGFALGILEQENDDDSASLLGGSGSGTSMTTGFGFRAASGLDLRLSNMFSATVQGRYQWIRFTDDLSLDDTFGGFGVDVGLTYRFQY